MKKLIIGLSITLISSLSLADVVEDILSSKVTEQIEQKKIVNKFDIYQCKYFKKDDSFDFRKWFQCLNSDSKERDASIYASRTNDLYSMLVRDYGLNSNVRCKTYSSYFGLSTQEKTQLLLNGKPITHTDKSFKSFKLEPMYKAPAYYKLGSPVEPNLDSARFSLWWDLDSDIKDIGLLQHPNITEDTRNWITVRFQNRHRFIENSCGTEFVTAFNKYLNDYSKFAIEKFKNEQLRIDEINRIDQKKRQEEIMAREKQNALIQENEKKSIQEYQASKLKEQRIAECNKQDNYKIYDLSNQIVNLHSWVNRAEKNLKDDDARSKISGVSNLQLRYEAANDILKYEKRINTVFKQYKLVGGTATKPSLVKRITNPCVY